ncbi:COG4-domain-containing protein [Cristinia sonorae]|uniref:Conserved oligomeric Golgi complex subunit 4 n=1 Tax=Cristinia sonorae TaxID=1940300 RepID=A0A8K0XRQ5_9AGAR|nr:COG4-domain-containing protein [Cristinia sonorae]
MAVAAHSTPSPSQSPSRPDPSTLTTLSDILASISALESEDAELSTSLTELLSAQEPIDVALRRVQSLEPYFNDLHLESGLLSETVSATALTAQRVGGKVRLLDEEMRRVREAGETVGQAIELKSSLAALQLSIEMQDWESATRHCARAMALPLEVTSGAFAESAVPTAENHLPPAQTLQLAREQLLEVFRRNFEEASKARDAAATSRFFKLFPAIGWEAEGLQAYASFVVDLVRVRAPASAKASSPLYYITALTALFESIAMIVDQHQPVVEKYYGPGKMTGVLERLLQESDRVVKDLLEGWEEERGMKRKLNDIGNTSAQTIVATQIRKTTSGATIPDEDVIDAREIDKVLSEASGMAGRWSLFRKFLYDRLRDQEGSEDNTSDDDANAEPAQLKKAVSPAPAEGVAEDPVLNAVESSVSRQLMDDMLTTYYIPLEIWYIRSAIDKAHRLSTPDRTQSPVVTTTPDDAFYILKVVLTRLLSTGSASLVKKLSKQLQEVMDREYSGVIKRKLDDVYRTGGAASSAAMREKMERESRQSFIILLNDLDTSSSHMERLVKESGSSQAILQSFLDSEVGEAKEDIASLANIIPRFRSTLRAGVEQLFNQLLRPKLRTFIPDVYKDVTYTLDDDGYAAAEYNDVVRKRFTKAWEGLVEGYKDAFTESNYRLFFGLALDVLVRPWEAFIKGLKYTELGAIRFDRDLRAITSYLSSQTAFGDVREKFIRLQQISTILNLDSEEDVEEFFNGSGIAWKLNEQEARTIAGLRV